MSTRSIRNFRLHSERAARACSIFHACLLAMAPCAGQSTGQIQGRVTAQIGGAVFAGTVVNVYRVGQGPAFSTKAITAKDGTYAVTGLPAGTYRVCASDRGGTVVDHCLWPDFHSVVAVAGAQSATADIQLKKATTLSVRVNDPGRNLSRKAGDTVTPHVLVGGFDMSGIFHPAREVKDAGGSTYELVIPTDFPVRMVVQSAQVAMDDDKRGAVPQQGHSEVVVQPSASAQGPSFTFHATGRKP